LNKISSGSRSRKQRLTAVGTLYADHVTPLYPRNVGTNLPTGGGRSVGIVRLDCGYGIIRGRPELYRMSVVRDVLFFVLHEDYHGENKVNTVSNVILLDILGPGLYEQRKDRCLLSSGIQANSIL
jgi:hypothetical protein